MRNRKNDRTETPVVISARDSGAGRVAGIAALVSMFSFFYYFRHGDVLLYGDAVAHINIARRVVDSQTPGLLQLGTVWLPLPHLLMVPFLWSNALWQNGAGGSIPSMVGFILAAVGMFRLVHGMLDSNPRTQSAAVVGAWVSVVVIVANPNLIYMQSTAMTESLYLALFIWAVVFIAEFVRGLPNDGLLKANAADAKHLAISLRRCAWCLAGAELTRYDGWFLAGWMGAAVGIVALWRWNDRALRRIAAKFALGIAVVPILWLAYNSSVYGNPLEFANGPYSAKAIEQRIGAPNPALHSIPTAAIYFLKSAQLNMAESNWGRFWLAAAVLALALAWWKLRPQSLPLGFLWMPLVFYSYSIAFGSVPLHVHTWWPFATFNQRYGLQLLPLFAVSTGLLTAFVFLLSATGRHAGKLVALLLALVVASYASVWKAQPQCFQEAQRNWDIRHTINSAVERIVTRLPRNSIYLMDLGEHVGVMEDAGIPLRQVINNENHRPWKRPTDPEGLWERALADPQHYVDYVLAFDGDPVDQFVSKTNLVPLAEIHATGQPHAHIYATRRDPNQSR
jgi:hypothetical protein